MNESKFGLMYRALRLQAGLGLREFCIQSELDPAYISRLERGRIKLPKREKIEELALAVGLERGTAQWTELLTQADIEAERIPKEILDDEEVIELLPAVCRSLNNRKADRDKVLKLMDLLKKA